MEAAKTLGADFGINYRSTDLPMKSAASPAGAASMSCSRMSAMRTFPESVRQHRPQRKAGDGWRPRRRYRAARSESPLSELRHHLRSTAQADADVERSLEIAKQSHLDVLIDRVMPLSEAAAAHALVAKRAGLGKIVLKPW